MITDDRSFLLKLYSFHKRKLSPLFRGIDTGWPKLTKYREYPYKLSVQHCRFHAMSDEISSFPARARVKIVKFPCRVPCRRLRQTKHNSPTNFRRRIPCGMKFDCAPIIIWDFVTRVQIRNMSHSLRIRSRYSNT